MSEHPDEASRSWGTLFDRAADHEATLAAVESSLERRRSGSIGSAVGAGGEDGEEGDGNG